MFAFPPNSEFKRQQRERSLSPDDLDLVSAATFALMTASIPQDAADAISTEIAAARSSVILMRGDGEKPAVVAERLTTSLQVHGLYDTLARKLAACADYRAQKIELRRDEGAWMLERVTSHAPHQVLPGLWIGGMYTASDDSELEKLGITHVCTVVDEQPKFPQSFRYLVQPMEDSPLFDPTPAFEVVNAFLVEALSNGGTVFVHCGSGISRAPTVVAAFLMATFGLSATQAVGFLQLVRPCVHPNPGFLKKLGEYTLVLRQQRSDQNCSAV